MNARETAMAEVLRRAIVDWSHAGPDRPRLLDYQAAAIVAALATPVAPTTEPGAYPCCGQCDPGCSGRHEWPCPRCQMSTTAAMYAVADEGAARAKGELA
jgi:hypothetical protein